MNFEYPENLQKLCIHSRVVFSNTKFLNFSAQSGFTIKLVEFVEFAISMINNF